MPTETELLAAAHDAADDWGLSVASMELLSHTENAVYRIDTASGQRLVMRLHRPGYNTLPEMESEMIWVDSLRAAGLDTPTAQRRKDGSAYSTVIVGDETRVVGLIDWVEGIQLETALENEPTTAAEQYHKLGRLAAGIHRHAEHWQPPAEFKRRRWDDKGLVGLDPLWGRFWEVPSLSSEERSLFTRARLQLLETLSALPQDQSVFGLIHADLHLRNVLVDGDRLVIIDFDDAGYGWYLHELAVALESALDEPWFDEARDALIEGYRSVRPISDKELELLGAFLAQRSLMIVAWLDARPELGLEAHLPAVINGAATEAERYLSSVGST